MKYLLDTISQEGMYTVLHVHLHALLFMRLMLPVGRKWNNLASLIGIDNMMPPVSYISTQTCHDKITALNIV